MAPTYAVPGLFNIHSSILLQNIKKVEGGPPGDIEKFSKSLSSEKNRKGTLQSRPVLYVTLKKEQL